jgi:predicted N-acetyltransferase YhbS
LHVAVRDDEGVVVGCATACWEPYPLAATQAGTRRLLMMAVVPEWQRQGLGNALVRAVVEDARRQDASWVWATARDSALAFYATLGFEVDGEGFMGAMDLPHHYIRRRP